MRYLVIRTTIDEAGAKRMAQNNDPLFCTTGTFGAYFFDSIVAAEKSAASLNKQYGGIFAYQAVTAIETPKLEEKRKEEEPVKETTPLPETELEAIEQSIVVWEELAETGGDERAKEEIVDRLYGRSLRGACPLCEYIRNSEDKYCSDCPLYKEFDFTSCGSEGTAYSAWEEADTHTERGAHAENVLFCLEDALEAASEGVVRGKEDDRLEDITQRLWDEDAAFCQACGHVFENTDGYFTGIGRTPCPECGKESLTWVDDDRGVLPDREG